MCSTPVIGYGLQLISPGRLLPQRHAVRNPPILNEVNRLHEGSKAQRRRGVARVESVGHWSSVAPQAQRSIQEWRRPWRSWSNLRHHRHLRHGQGCKDLTRCQGCRRRLQGLQRSSRRLWRPTVTSSSPTSHGGSHS